MRIELNVKAHWTCSKCGTKVPIKFKGPLTLGALAARRIPEKATTTRCPTCGRVPEGRKPTARGTK